MRIAVTGGFRKARAQSSSASFGGEVTLVVDLECPGQRGPGSSGSTSPTTGQVIDALRRGERPHDGIDALVHFGAIPAPAS